MNEKLKIQKIIKQLCKKQKEILFCYIFGSFLGKYFNPEKSDIDIAIYLKNGKNIDFFEKKLEFIEKFSRALKNNKIDIVILNRSSPFLKFVIISEGKLIYEKNKSKRIDFEILSINEYFDYKPYIELYNKKLLNSLK